MGGPIFKGQIKVVSRVVSKNRKKCLTHVTQLVEYVLKSKRSPFDPQSGHTPRLQVWSLVKMHTRGNQSMFLPSVFLSLSLSLPSPLFHKQTNKQK